MVGDESIARLEYHLDLYERASGAKVNREKREGLWLGSDQSRTDKPLGFRWTSDRSKLLGIHIGNMYAEFMENERPLFKRKKNCDKYFSCCMSLLKGNFRPKGDGRSGPGVPPLPEKKLNILGVLNIEKLTRSVFWLFMIVN